MKRHQSSVKFMGHLLTSQGLRPDPEKIQAILQLLEPKDVTALKRFLGMVTYLAKFMPHLLEMTEPLRRLEDKNVEFQWLPQHSRAINPIKKFLTEIPVPHYYDISKPITVQCDASQSGLGLYCCKMASLFAMLPEPLPTPTQNLDTNKSRKRCSPSLGRVTSSTNTSTGET